MSGAGIGAFFGGLGEGYDAQSRINAMQARNQREAEAHGIAMQNAKLELGEKQKEIAYKDDLSKNMTALAEQAKPVEVTDPATGQVSMRPGMDPLMLQQKAADTLKEVAFKYGKVDLNMLNQSMEFGKKIKGEGAMEAMRYAMTNIQDQEGIRKIFNEKGDVKLGKDIQIGLEQGMFGTTVVGYRVDAKGQKQQVFDGFRDIIMPSMSTETYAKIMADFKTTEMKEQGANYRSDSGNRTQLGVAGINKASARELKMAELDRADKKEAISQLAAMGNSNTQSALRNPIGGMSPERTFKLQSEINAVARDVMDNNSNYKNNPQLAEAYARDFVYNKYGVSTEQLGLKKK